MKKIISIILLSTISIGSFSEGVFNMQIPQPDYISNDWDGDGSSIVAPYVYTGETCEDDGMLLQETVNELNLWSGLSNSSVDWCNLTYLNLPSKMLTFITEKFFPIKLHCP